MRLRKLGSSDLEVSEISLGSWLTYSGGVAFDQTRACTDAAFEAGINFFDTANVYGRGAAESAWGEILAARPRDSYVLATKVWGQMSDDTATAACRQTQIAKQIDASLDAPAHRPRRPLPGPPLRPRRPDRGDDRGAAAGRRLGQGALPRLQRVDAGADPGGDRHRRAPTCSSPPSRSTRCCGRRPRPRSSRCAPANGISQIVWSPLAQGVLTGKYRPGEPPPPDSRAAHSEMGAPMELLMSDERLEAVERLRPIADRRGLSLTELALAWVLRRPELASAIIGASRPEQVHANVEGVGHRAHAGHARGHRRGARRRPGEGAHARAVRAAPG